MRVLVACESSGVVREAFRALGHSAWSCDLQPADDGSGYHFQQDVREVLQLDGWDLLIAHPPCTYLSSSGMHWTTRGLRDPQLTDDAAEFFLSFTRTKIPHVAIENPVGIMSTRYRKPDQYIQPYQFGEDASKKTGLWLHNLPPLVHTEYAEPRIVNGKPRWSNQTDSGQNRLGPSSDRWKIRSSTYPGIAKAMAEQWTKYIGESYMLTENEQRLLDYYRTPVGEKEWRTSDLAWVEYKKLEEKEKNGRTVRTTLG